MRSVVSFASDEVRAAAKVPNIAEVLAANAAIDAAFAAHDVEALASLWAEDFVVNSPGNRVARFDDALGFFRAGLMNYEDFDKTIEFVEDRGDLVVIMGGEIVKPRDKAGHAGQTAHRRFTEIWRKDLDGRWRLTVRQATITSV